jgi:hypothetical protein
MKKIVLYIGVAIAALFLLVNLYIFASGRIYIYDAVKLMKAGIFDYKIFNNRVIHTESPQELPNSVDYNKQPLPAGLEKELIDNESVAFVLLRNDSVLAEQYWNHSDTAISGSFSMAKTIVSILTGAALKDGKIKSLDQKVGDFLLDNDGLLHDQVARAANVVRHTFAGIGVYQPELFEHTPAHQPAKLAPLLRQAMKNNRVCGTLHQSEWIDVGTPERLAALEGKLMSIHYEI